MRNAAKLLMAILLAVFASASDALPAEDETTVFGTFKQADVGGIVLVPQGVTHVLYLPFSPGSIMGDVRDIQVQVQGTVRSTFRRDGTEYRVLAVSKITPMTKEYGNTRTENRPFYGISGTDAVEIHAYSDSTCYLYDRYVIQERPSYYTSGNHIRILTRGPQDAPSALCENLQGKPLFEIPNDGNFAFAGLSGDTLILRNGPAQGVHGLMAVNLSQKRQTLDVTVTPSESLKNNRYLEFLAKVTGPGRHPACPATGTLVQKTTLDLQTGHLTKGGEVRCVQ